MPRILLGLLTLFLNHTLFTALGINLIRGYPGNFREIRKLFFLSLIVISIPMLIYIGLRHSGMLISALAFSVILVYLAVFIALIRLAYREFHTGQVFILIGINGIGVSVLGLLNSLGSFFLFSYLFVLIVLALFWATGYMAREKRIGQIIEKLPAWENQRRIWIGKQAASDTPFHTFCFECIHFNPEQKNCGLTLHAGEIKKCHFPAITRESFCLYWNIKDHPNIKHSHSYPEMVKQFQKI